MKFICLASSPNTIEIRDDGCVIVYSGERGYRVLMSADEWDIVTEERKRMLGQSKPARSGNCRRRRGSGSVHRKEIG